MTPRDKEYFRRVNSATSNWCKVSHVTSCKEGLCTDPDHLYVKRLTYPEIARNKFMNAEVERELAAQETRDSWLFE